MDPQTATRVLIEGGKSEDFIAATELLAQTESQGQHKFAKPVVQDVVRALSCRAHGPMVHQLCHLMAAAERLPDGAWDLFWGDRPATPGQAAGWFRTRVGGERAHGDIGVQLSENGISLRYGDGGFRIAFGQMPVLIALAELLVTTIQFPALDTARATVARPEVTTRDISTASNALARTVYAYLSENLPTTQESRIFHTILGFLEARYGADVDVRQVDDEAILRLWETHADSEGFRTFSGVVANVIRFRQTLERTAEREAFDHPDPIGTDRDAGEVDPAESHVIAREVAAASDPLATLASPPADRVKFLNKREHRDLQLLVESGDLLEQYYLSILRAEVFGPFQRRLAQALRTRNSDVAAVLAAGPESDFAQQEARFRALASHIDRVRKATLAALLKTRHEAAVPLAMQLAPEASRAALVETLQDDAAMPDVADAENVVALPTQRLAQRGLDALQDPKRVGEAMAELVGTAGQALNNLSRQGFRPPLDGDAFAAGEPALADLDGRLARAQTAAEALSTPRDALFAADHARIHRRLAAIYTGADE